jgi:predicted metalloprotease with PDZ domain
MMKALAAIFLTLVTSWIASVSLQDSEYQPPLVTHKTDQVSEAEVAIDGKQESEVQATVGLVLENFLNPTAHQGAEEKVTLLGVHVRRPDKTLRRHLKIKSGMGLVVEQVVTGAAAEKAGLAIDDVMLRWEDQWLVNEDQLTTLVRNSVAGEKVAIAIVRDGAEQQVEVTLEQGTVAAAASSWIDLPSFEFSADNMHQHMTDPRFRNCAACHVSPHTNLQIVPVRNDDGTKLDLKPDIQ